MNVNYSTKGNFVIDNIFQQSFLISLEQPDGTTQLVQLTEEQAEALGIIFKSDICESIHKPLHKNTSSKSVYNGNNLIHKGIDNGGVKMEAVNSPLGSCDNPIQIIQDGKTIRSTQNLTEVQLKDIAQALRYKIMNAEDGCVENSELSNNFVYRIVYPEELNLKPILAKQSRRGRPKKRPAEDVPKQESVKIIPQTLVKSMRTRSGRITRPPRHIEKDFKKIEMTEIDDLSEDLKTTDFEPLKTNQKPVTDEKSKVFTDSLENHQRKRNIASQYRCPKCKKAYLGHSRMIKHLQQNPDHGPIPEHCKPKENVEVWNFLIDMVQKCAAGYRGLKFYEELYNLLHNARILARFLFKPICGDKSIISVDKAFGSALDIEPGNYSFNENELRKDVAIFSILDHLQFENTFLEESCASKEVNQNQNIDANVCDNIVNNGKKNCVHENINDGIFERQNIEHNKLGNSLDHDSIQSLSKNIDNLNQKVCNFTLNENGNINKNGDNNFSKKKVQIENSNVLKNNFSANQNVKESSNASTCDLNPSKNESSVSFLLEQQNGNTKLNVISSDDKSTVTGNVFNLSLKQHKMFSKSLDKDNQNVKVNIDTPNPNSHPKTEETFNFKISHVEQCSINLEENCRNFNGSDDPGVFSFTQNNSIKEVQTINHLNKKQLEINNPDIHMSLHHELLSDNSLLNSLPNLRTSVEELMCVDNNHVSSILDSSISSDEVMNVDQFVNERLKSLTEHDLELPNSSLNLELPHLDLFQFHSS